MNYNEAAKWLQTLLVYILLNLWVAAGIPTLSHQTAGTFQLNDTGAAISAVVYWFLTVVGLTMCDMLVDAIVRMKHHYPFIKENLRGRLLARFYINTLILLIITVGLCFFRDLWTAVGRALLAILLS